MTLEYNDRITNKLIMLFHSPVLITLFFSFFSFITLIFVIAITITIISTIIIINNISNHININNISIIKSLLLINSYYWQILLPIYFY